MLRYRELIEIRMQCENSLIIILCVTVTGRWKILFQPRCCLSRDKGLSLQPCGHFPWESCISFAMTAVTPVKVRECLLRFCHWCPLSVSEFVHPGEAWILPIQRWGLALGVYKEGHTSTTTLLTNGTACVEPLPDIWQVPVAASRQYGRFDIFMEQKIMEPCCTETRLDGKAGCNRDLPQLTWNGNLYTLFNLMAVGFGHYGMATIERSKKRVIPPLQAILKHALNQ